MLSPEETAAQLRCPHGRAAEAVGREMAFRNLAQTAACLHGLQPQADAALLEIGCGNGALLGYVLAHARNMRYTGAEISAAMHEAACAFNRPFIEAGLAQYLLYDGITLPCADGAFDGVFSVNTVYFWTDPAAMLRECARVLRPEGSLCLGFCEKSFMQTLPFAQYGFALYDAADIRALAPASLTCTDEQRQHDWAVSKSGTLVERETVYLRFVRG